MGIGEATTRAPLLGEPVPVELMNTIWADRAGVHDALSTRAEVAAWLRAVEHRLTSDCSDSSPRSVLGLPGLDGHVPDPVAEHLRQLRDALRRLAADVTADTDPPAASAMTDRPGAIAVLNQACALAPSWSQLTWPVDGPPRRMVRTTRTPGELAVSVLAELGMDLFAGTQRTELRACRAPGCVLYFVKDHPRREWCSPGCGNRARVARHYQRHRRSPAIGGVPPRPTN